MAEYLRRKQLYVAERSDRVGRAAIGIGVRAALAGGATAALAAVVGASALATALAAVAVAAAVLGVFAARFYATPPEIQAWRQDAEAEQITARALDRLQRAGYTVLHDRALPDSGANIDHLVIGPSGAWLIETDSHRGKLRKNSGGLWVGDAPLRPMFGLVTWMTEEAAGALVADLPGGWELAVQPVVAFARAERCDDQPLAADGTLLVPGSRRLRRQRRKGAWLLEDEGIMLMPASQVANYVLAAGVVLKPLDVAMLVDVAGRTFPPYEVAGPPPSSWPGRSLLRGLLRR